MSDARSWPRCYANLCSFVARLHRAGRRSAGPTLTYGLLKQFPVLAPEVYRSRSRGHRARPALDWLLPRVLELTYTAWDLEPFARDCGYDGPPFRWDEARRFLLRCELDAAFFHLYGLGRDDAAYILDTFPVVRKRDEAKHGEYRTERVILEIYDRMADAARTGVPYATLLDPPPADPRVAHPADPVDLTGQGQVIQDGVRRTTSGQCPFMLFPSPHERESPRRRCGSAAPLDQVVRSYREEASVCGSPHPTTKPGEPMTLQSGSSDCRRGLRRGDRV